MTEPCRGRAYVVGPYGSPLTLADLPAPGTTRWGIRRKAEIIAAVRGGLLSLEEACSHYTLTVEEFLKCVAVAKDHTIRHCLDLSRRITNGFTAPRMFDNWARRKKARQLLVINQTPVRVAAPGWCENHLDGSLGDIDIEIGFDRMPDHFVPRPRIALPGLVSWLRCARYFCGPYFVSLSNRRASTGVSIRTEPSGISSARLGLMIVTPDRAPSPRRATGPGRATLPP
jgi:hypothetical protein